MAKAILEEKISESGIVKLIGDLAVETTYTKKVSGISIDELEDRIDYEDMGLEKEKLDPTIRALAVLAEGLKHFKKTLRINMFDYFGSSIEVQVFGDNLKEFKEKYGDFAENLYLGAHGNEEFLTDLNTYVTEYQPKKFTVDIEIRYVAHMDDVGYGMEEPDGYESTYILNKRKREAEAAEDSDEDSDESSYYSEDTIWDRQSETFRRIVERPIDAFIDNLFYHFNPEIYHTSSFTFR